MSQITSLFTSESVTCGHPDKVADQISDAVLDAHLQGDPQARVACEVLIKTGLIVVAGEVRSKVDVDVARLARACVQRIGYTERADGFDVQGSSVLVALQQQSADIARGVDAGEGHEQGAGDQGMMFGYACDETPTLMPAPVALAHALAQRLAHVRRTEPDVGLRPDGKTQVSVVYVDGEPSHVQTVLVSTQHRPEVQQEALREHVIDRVVREALPERWWRDDTRVLVNPTGRFVTGGPEGDAGLTGRKIIVDTYGGAGRHGGGAFSGKDPSKVDRSGAYFARYMAKNVVAAGLARRCEVQLAYAIGCAAPVSVLVHTFGTAAVDEHLLHRAVAEAFDARPAQIIEQLDLLRPIYQQTAAYGHFGRAELALPWERTDRVEALRRACQR